MESKSEIRNPRNRDRKNIFENRIINAVCYFTELKEDQVKVLVSNFVEELLKLGELRERGRPWDKRRRENIEREIEAKKRFDFIEKHVASD